ncbi:toprim domain-containing protein [Candidatus Daviesbacteria bacterium]|nr:toprim domain-containing protein [Candidatus Daviesbacteria bacterium]
MVNYLDWVKKIGIDGRFSGNEYIACCPLHGEKHPSFSLNLQTGLWNCFSNCGGGNFVSLVQKVYDVSLLEATKLISDEMPGQINFDLDIEEDNTNLVLPEVKFPFVRNNFPKWILDRGFTKDILTKWKCGFNPDSGSFVISVYDEKKRLVGWICRQPNGKEPKYINSTGLEKSKIVFGLYNIKQRRIVCVTEGALNTIWLNQHGFSSVAILGARLSRRQEELLSIAPITELIICLDNDEAGRKGRDEIYAIMKKYFQISFIQIPNEYNDVQDIKDPKLLTNIIKNRTMFKEGVI